MEDIAHRHGRRGYTQRPHGQQVDEEPRAQVVLGHLSETQELQSLGIQLGGQKAHGNLGLMVLSVPKNSRWWNCVLKEGKKEMFGGKMLRREKKEGLKQRWDVTRCSRFSAVGCQKQSHIFAKKKKTVTWQTRNSTMWFHDFPGKNMMVLCGCPVFNWLPDGNIWDPNVHRKANVHQNWGGGRWHDWVAGPQVFPKMPNFITRHVVSLGPKKIRWSAGRSRRLVFL